MDVGERRGQPLGLEPAVDHLLRLSELSTSPSWLVNLVVAGGRLVDSLISRSWVLAANFPVVLALALTALLEVLWEPAPGVRLFLA